MRRTVAALLFMMMGLLVGLNVPVQAQDQSLEDRVERLEARAERLEGKVYQLDSITSQFYKGPDEEAWTYYGPLRAHADLQSDCLGKVARWMKYQFYGTSYTAVSCRHPN
jgi:hypothetical protein